MFRIALLFVFPVLCVFAMQPSAVAEDTLTLTDAIILDGLSEDPKAVLEEIVAKSVVASVCRDEQFRELSQLVHGDCVAASEVEAQQCWSILKPLLPDFGFGTPSFLESANQEQLLSTLVAMEKCVEASILLPHDELPESGADTQEQND